MTVASFAKIFSKKQSQKKKLRTQRNCSKKAKRKQRVKFTNIWITINYSKHTVPQYKTTKCTKSLGENEQYSINLPVIFWSRFACFDRSLCFDRNCYTQREILLSIAFFLFIAFLVRLWNSSVVYMNICIFLAMTFLLLLLSIVDNLPKIDVLLKKLNKPISVLISHSLINAMYRLSRRILRMRNNIFLSVVSVNCFVIFFCFYFQICLFITDDCGDGFLVNEANLFFETGETDNWNKLIVHQQKFN